MPPRLILHIDDATELPRGVPEALAQDGYEIVHTADPEEAMRLAEERRPALVIMEIELQECEGPDLMAGVRDIDSGSVPVLVVTTVPRDSALHGEAIALGVADFLTKPIGGTALLDAIEEIAPLPSRVARQPTRAVASLSGDLGDTPMPELMARLRRRGATGLLRVRHGRLRVGVQLRNGSPIGVSSNRRARRADAALHETFRWDKGRFAFSEDGWLDPESMLELTGDPAALLLTGVFDASPAEQIRLRLAKRESLYVTCPDPSDSRFEAEGIRFTKVQQEQLERLGGEDTLSSLLQSGVFGERLLYALWVAGWLDLHTKPTLALTELLGEVEADEEPQAVPPDPRAAAFALESDEFQRAREEHERELTALARSRCEQEQALEQLARAREERVAELEELERARRARAQEHEALAPALEERTRELEELERRRARHARELRTLEKAREAQARELDELARAREQRERAHQALAPALEERTRELDDLTKARAERACELDALAHIREEHQREVDALARVREEHQREVDALARAREEHTRELAGLATALQERSLDLETLEAARREHEREIAALARVREEQEREIAALAKVRDESESEIQVLAQEHALLVGEHETLVRERKARETEQDPSERSRTNARSRPEPTLAPPDTDTPHEAARTDVAPPEPSVTESVEPEEKHGGLALLDASAVEGGIGDAEGALRALAKRVLSGDDFEALGIAANTTDAEVRAAYEATLREIPDIEPTAANLVHAQQARRIRDRVEAAYANLCDDEKRRAYSLLREEEEQDRKAKPSAERALEGERWLRKGKAHLERKEYERAVEAFGMAAHLDPEQGEYASHLGYALFLSNPDDEVVRSEAMEHLASGIKRSPRHEHAYLYLGRIMKAKGDIEVAKKIFEKALRIKRDFHPAIQELRVLEMRERSGKGVLSRLIGR